jgi:hypothetical protein
VPEQGGAPGAPAAPGDDDMANLLRRMALLNRAVR